MKYSFLSVIVLLTISMILVSCSEDEANSSQVGDTFSYEDMTLQGVEGKFGIIKMNGETNEPEFQVNKGRLYYLYFLDENKDFNGETYMMTATHKETEETVELYEDEIQNNQSGAKFALDEGGLWEINVLVGGEPYTNFVVEVE